ncbi:MAG: CHAP domain-containing protein [Sporichthyaceae bacterium]
MTPPLKPVPRLKHPGTAEALIAVASSQLGYRESGDNDNAFGAWYGMNRVPWCAQFVSWAAAESGCARAIPRHAYTPAGAAWFRKRNRWGSTPRPGAIAYFYNARLRRIAHVGIVVKVDADGSFLTVEGNTNSGGSRQGIGVFKLRRAGTRGGGFGYPDYLVGPKVLERSKDRPVRLASVRRKARELGVYDGRVGAALRAEGYSADVEGYRRWQHELGFRRADADGIAGAESLTALGDRYGWTVDAGEAP